MRHRPSEGLREGVELVVDLSSGSVVLRDHGDLKRLSVLVRPQGDAGGTVGSLRRLAEVLGAHDAGTVGPDGGVLLPEAVLRRLAFDAVGEEGRSLAPAWETDFTGMLDYASANGWVAEDGSLRVHVEWGS